jgi:hypothetical protein
MSIHPFLLFVDVDHENPSILWPKSMRLFLNIVAYTPFRDLFTGNFVLVHLANPKVYHVWMGKVKSDVLRD